MTTLTVEEASQNLSGWLLRAMNGEEIAIHEGTSVVLLQPFSTPAKSRSLERLGPHEALKRLQFESRLTAAQAEEYVRDIRDERMADGKRGT
jgi:antitoxin (DNA-binding transcriptional repressor) of toxin-antitoxin stability system